MTEPTDTTQAPLSSTDPVEESADAAEEAGDDGGVGLVATVLGVAVALAVLGLYLVRRRG